MNELAASDPAVRFRRGRRLSRRATPIADQLTRLALVGAAFGGLIGIPTAYSVLATPAPQRDASPFAPGDAPAVDPASLGPREIARAHDGMFYAAVTINGVKLRCLIDTGASAMVLDAADRRLGLADRASRPNGHILTAGGSRPATRTRIAALSVAGRDFRSVPAILVRGSDTPCLLGQDMLGRLDAVELHGDRLVMR